MDYAGTYGRTEIIRWSQNDDSGNPAVYHHVCSEAIQNVISVSLSKFITANTWFDVVEGLNDAIDFTLPVDDPGVTHTAYIPAGKYDHDAYAAALKKAINDLAAPPGNSDVKYEDVAEFKFDIKYDRGVVWLFGTGPSTDRSVINELGFPAVDIAELSGVWLTAYNASHLGCSSPMLRSSKLSGGRYWGTQSSKADQSLLKDVLFVLPPTGNPGVTCTHYTYEDLHSYLMSDNTISFQGPRTIDTFDLSLMTTLQKNTEPLDINGGVPMVLVLTFQCLKKWK